jgi:terminase small subunit / prophage DNA-packing protein
MATQEEVAQHIDLSSRQVRTLVKSGVLPSSSGTGGLSLDDCRMAYIRYLRGRATGRVTVDTAELDVHKERARLTHHQANIASLEEREREGELVKYSDVVAEVSDAVANTRAKLLAIPTKISTVIVGMDRLSDVEDVLETAVLEALEELYNEYAGDATSGESLESPAEVESQ